MNPNWIVFAIGVTGAIVIFASSRLRRVSPADLGTLSHQWMAERRLRQGHESQR